MSSTEADPGLRAGPGPAARADAGYVTLGIFFLLATAVLQVATSQTELLVLADIPPTIFWAAAVPTAFVAIAVFLWPRSVRLGATIGLFWFFSFYTLDIAIWAAGQGMAPVAWTVSTLLLTLFPLLLILTGLLPRVLIAQATGAAGLAMFVVAAVEFAIALDPARMDTDEAVAAGLIDPDVLPPPATAPGAPLPDIVYIVPDRYGSAEAMKRVFGHDNSGFLAALRQRGFLIAEESRANYPTTRHSLASSMNLQYIEDALAHMHAGMPATETLYNLIGDSLVHRRLDALGYRHVHVASWWDGTRGSRRADAVVDELTLDVAGQFGDAVLTRFPLVPMAQELFAPDAECIAQHRRLEALARTGGQDRPTFTFAHLTIPHSPILTDAAGTCRDVPDYPRTDWPTFSVAYSDYARFFESRVLAIFDRQRAENPNPLIFVIQADEGPYPRALRDFNEAREDADAAAAFDWSTADLATKFGIINAIYVGVPHDRETLAARVRHLSPVNNWRLIFGAIEGRDYPLLEDRHYIVTDGHVTRDVTERLRAPR